MSNAIPVEMMMKQVALALSEDYFDFIEQYDPYAQNTEMFMTVQAYVRSRILNEIEDAISYAVQYSETNGGL